MQCPTFNIDLNAFWQDPYPLLANMRRHAPVCYVPELDATLLTLHDDIFRCEKMVDVFSSEQPGGLMTELMGQNMMRKDGDPHLHERRQMQPAVSPKTTKTVWAQKFDESTRQVLDTLAGEDTFDLVRDYAMPVSAHALRFVTGLTNLSVSQMDEVSQAMIDGIANYAGDKEIQQRCIDATQLIDQSIDDMLNNETDLPSQSILNVLRSSGQQIASLRANVKLAISGGQNEPRDAIAGTAWAVMKHPEQMRLIQNKQALWSDAFEEYARWISPIGMSPRRMAREYIHNGYTLPRDTRAFLMFGSGNRDESVFENSSSFDLTRNTSKAISFGAGPHFCAGAAISRSLIGEIALPLLFQQFPHLRLDGPAPFGGWAFRGPLSMPVATI